MKNLMGRNPVTNQEKMKELELNVIRMQYEYQVNKDHREELMDYI